MADTAEYEDKGAAGPSSASVGRSAGAYYDPQWLRLRALELAVEAGASGGDAVIEDARGFVKFLSEDSSNG